MKPLKCLLESHDWGGFSHTCTCSRCGGTRDTHHDWTKGARTCDRCGVRRDEWRARQTKETVLLDVSGEGDLQAVRKLIEAGANVNAADESGWTPLMKACCTDKHEREHAF